MNIYELVFVVSFLFVMWASISIGASIGGVLGGIIGMIIGLGLLAIEYRLLKRASFVSPDEIDQILKENDFEKRKGPIDPWSKEDVEILKEKSTSYGKKRRG